MPPALERSQSPSAARPGRSREHWLVVGLAALALLGLAVLGLFLTPDARGVGTHEQLGLRPCSTMALWNVPCPGCGVTTSVTLAAKGHLWDSFTNQPFGFLVFLAAVAFVLWAPIAHLRGRDLWRDLLSVPLRPWAIGVGTFAALAWIYKIWRVRSG